MPPTEKTDLYKLLKAEYAAPKTPKLIEVSEGSYLTIEGRGRPGGEEFTAKIGALYTVAYTSKMTRKDATDAAQLDGRQESLTKRLPAESAEGAEQSRRWQ